MDKNQKAQVLLTTAKAYLARGAWVQYDQLSMDRFVRCSPRRSAFAAPEAGTEDLPLFLDCSSFVWNCYYQTFGYMLEADLTWHMIDVLPDRVFYYEPTHRETPEEQQAICDQVRALLEPGDIVTFERTAHSGHTMLYAGEGQFIHSTQKHGFNGYKYDESRNILDPEGTIGMDTCDRWFTPWDGRDWTKLYLLRDNVKRFSVHRPLSVAGDPTEQALIRCGKAKDLVCSVTADYKPGQTVPNGKPVVYTVAVRNDGADDQVVEIEYTAKSGIVEEEQGFRVVSVPAGETEKITFTVTADAESAYIEEPQVFVNGLRIWTPRVMVGAALPAECAAKLATAAHGLAGGKEDVLAALHPVWESCGYSVPESTSCALHSLFFLHDTELVDVVSRRPQKPGKDLCVYKLYGGIGVVTPQNATGADIRTTHITKEYLQPGDLILCADDALFTRSYAVLWTGEKLSGCFEYGAVASERSGKEAERWIDTLFGRFVFAVMRPSLGGRKER
ncbi:MAG: C40 family peptidase [Firmicutes bacterium]|nr:C40 family peptidase [Bacillota bacterium]